MVGRGPTSDSQPPVDPQRRHLDRLETLTDSIYALVIVFLVAQFPSPLESDTQYGNLFAFLVAEKSDLVAPLIGLVLIITYWIQNNAVTGYLEGTDNKHATLAIVQLIFVLFYLYTAYLLDAFPDTRSVLAIQSTVLASLGLLSLAGWHYACKDRRLIGDEVTEDEILSVRRMLLPEPITALITLPCAAISVGAWNLAWLSFPLVAFLVRRRV